MTLRARLLLSLLFLAAFAVLSAKADTIIARTGQAFTAFPIGPNNPTGVAWSSASAYSNVFITARLISFNNPGQTGVAYLTTQIGPGATVTDQVASAPFVFSLSASDVVLFTGLSLTEGTFYLTLVANQDGSGGGNSWLGGTGVNPPPPTTAPGVTYDGQFRASSAAAYVPASNFSLPATSSGLLFSVTGDAVPEPATSVLIAGAAILGGLAPSFRRRAGAAER